MILCCPRCGTSQETQGWIIECPVCFHKGKGEVIHDFSNKLIRSYEHSKENWVEEAYWDAFGNLGLVRIEEIYDKELQRKGYDKVCYFKNGKQVIFDEKHREKDYGDILIEVYSNMVRRTPSWLRSNADYIANFFEPTKRVIWLPLLLLNKWLKTRNEIVSWLGNPGNKSLLPCPPWNRVIYARNPGYITASIAAPNEFVLDGIREVMEEGHKFETKQLTLLDFTQQRGK